MKKEVDKDTQKVLSEGEKITNLVDSDEWKTARKKLYDKLITLDSLSGVPKEGKTNEDIINELKVREGVVSIILAWIKEIEGIKTKHQFDKKMFEEIRKDSILQYFE